MSRVVETLLVEIEARGAEATLGRLDRGFRGAGDSAVQMERKVQTAEAGSRRFAGAASSVDQALANQIRTAASAIATIGGLVGMYRQFTTAANVFRAFEYEMAQVKAISGATKEEFIALREEAMRLGKVTMFTAQEVANAELILTQAGFKTTETLSALPTVLDLSLVGQLNLAQATDYTASALRGFGIEAADAARVADVYGKAASLANITVEDLGEGMKYVAPLSRALGLSLEETAAALAVLGDAGIKGMMGGTSLRTIFASMLQDSSETRDALRRLGLTMADIDPQTQSLAQSLSKFEEAGIGAASAMEMFENRGGPGVLVLTKNIEKIDRFTSILEKTAGSGRQMASVMEDTMQGSFKALVSAVENVQLKFGEGLSPALRDAMDLFTAFFRSTDGAERFGREVGEIISILAQVLLFAAENADVLKVALGSWLTLRIYEWLSMTIANLLAAAAATTTLAASESAATQVAAAHAAAAAAAAAGLDIETGAAIRAAEAEAALAISATAASSALQAEFGSAVRAAEAETALAASSTAAAGGTSALAASTGALNIALTAVVALLLLANERVKSWADESVAEMQRLQREAEKLQGKIDAGQSATKGAVRSGDPLRISQELSRQLNDELALTEDLAEAKARLSEANQGLAVAQSAADGALLHEDRAAAVQDVENWREKVSQAEAAWNDVNRQLGAAKKNIQDLQRAQEGVGLPEPNPAATNPPSENERKLAEATAETRKQAAALLDVAKAYGISTAAGRDAAAAMEVEANVRRAAAQWADLDTSALQRNIRAKAEAQKLAAGAQRIADLRLEIASQRALAEAWKAGASAAAVQAAANKLAADQMEATAGAAEDQRGKIADLVAILATLTEGNARASANDALVQEVGNLQLLADAFAESTAAGLAEQERQRIENEVRAATIGVMGRERDAIEALVRARATASTSSEFERSRSAMQDEVDLLRKRAEIRRDAFQTERAYLEAQRSLTIEEKANRRILAAKVDTASEAADEIRRLTRQESDLTVQIERQDRELLTTAQRWASLGEAMQGAYDGVDDGTAQVLSGLGKVVEGLAAAAEASTRLAESKAWATVAQGLYSIAEAAGVLQQNVSAGGFGGRGEGNYATEGSSVGAVVGAIIGAYFGSPQVGMAIGSAAGGILGSFIQKGAEEALAVSVDGINGISLMVTKSEGGLGRVLSDIGYSLNRALLDLMDVLGGAIVDLPSVSAKVRDGIITMVVGGVRGKFKEMDDAISFALAELLKQGQIEGMSDTIRQILSRTAAPDLSSLTADLEFGQWYERLGLADAGVAFLDAMANFRNNLRKAIEFGLDTEPIYADLARNLGDIRNQILGVSESEEERIRRQAAAYNAQALLFIAEQQAKKVDLDIKKAQLEARIELLRAEAGISEGEMLIGLGRYNMRRAGIDQEARFLLTEYELLDAEFDLYQQRGEIERTAVMELAATLYQLRQVVASIDAINSLLTGVQLISPDDIDRAIGNLPGAPSGSDFATGFDDTAQALESFLSTLEQVERSALPSFEQSLLALRDKFSDLAAQAIELGQSEERVAAARRIALDQLKASLVDPIRPYLTPDQGGTYGLNDLEAQAAAVRRQFDELRRANELLLQTEGELAISRDDLSDAERRALKAVAQAAVDSLGLPMEGVRKKVKALGDALNYLRSMESEFGSDSERFAQVMGEVMDMASSELLGLAAGLLEQMGATEEAAQIRRQLEEAEFHLKVAELNYMYQQYVAMGLLSEAVKAQIGAILEWINDPANWPDFSAAPPASSSGAGDGGGSPTVPDEWPWQKALREMQEQAAQWNELQFGPLTQQARELRKTYEDLRAEAARWNLSLTEFDAAWAIARANFVDDALAEFEHLGESDGARRLRELNEQFADIRASFEAIGATQEEMARLEVAQQAALAAFWQDLTENARNFLDEIHAEDPRVGSRARLSELRAQFAAAVSAAQAGDLSAIDRAVELGRQLQDLGASVWGTSSGAFSGMMDEIAAAIQGLIDMGPGSVADQTLDVQRQQLDIQTRMLAALGGSVPSDAGSLLTSTGRRERLSQPIQLQTSRDSFERQRAEREESDRRLRLLEEELANERRRTDRLLDAIETLTGRIEEFAGAVTRSSEESRREGGARYSP